MNSNIIISNSVEQVKAYKNAMKAFMQAETAYYKLYIIVC